MLNKALHTLFVGICYQSNIFDLFMNIFNFGFLYKVLVHYT